MGKMPGRLLRNVQIAMELHARLPLEPRRQHVGGDHPILRSEIGMLHDRSGAHREELATGAAVVVHGRMPGTALHVAGIAVRADGTSGPADAGDPFLSRPVIRGTS